MSNDYKHHKRLAEKEIDVLVLDHHLADSVSDYALVINNQLSKYPNKELSGVGVVWQFCRYIDALIGESFAMNFLDLVALGLVGDMMSLLSTETRFLIYEGFKEQNIKNPFIYNMIEKNSFPLSKPDYKSSDAEQACTPMGAAFFIVPFVNATTRTGTQEEKKLIFESMLTHKAFSDVPETKRGKETGNTEPLVTQAVRAIGNIKNRQSKNEEVGMALLEKKIKEENLLDNKVLLFLLKPGEIPNEIRGLCANKMMAKYQRPCCVLTDNGDMYEGSMRGYTRTGLDDFKSLLQKCDGIEYCEGHHNAGGVGLKKDKVEDFIASSNELMKDISTEPIFYVDYYFKDEESVDKNKILEIAQMNDLWGQDMPRSYVAINFRVTSDNFFIMKSNTLKISLNNGVSLIKFGGTEDDIANFSTQGWKNVVAVCKCNQNEWMNAVTPQLIIEDYEILDGCEWEF